MLTLPITVANPVKQPVFPTQTLLGITGLRNWWTLQRQEQFINAQGKQSIAPRVGNVALVQNTASIIFGSFTAANGAIRNPMQVSGSESGASAARYYSANIPLKAADWNSFVCCMNIDNVTGVEPWGVNPAGTGVLFSNPRRTGSTGSVQSDLDPTQDVPLAPASTLLYEIVAINFATGAMRRSISGGMVATGSFPNMALTPTATSALNVGAKVVSQPFSGQIFDFGHAEGDLTADPSKMSALASYFNALYGI